MEKLDKIDVISDKCSMTTPFFMGYVRKLVPEHSTLMIEVLFVD